ncbi:GIY-YIG nuclease family protein [Photobacterium swingsii]|nr:GIY-YIG nuclease family protein [Photobacterium swingsii]
MSGHITDLDILFAELIFPILIERVTLSDPRITYGDIVEEVKARHPHLKPVKTFHHRHVGRRLGTIWEFTKSQGCPHLGALVVDAQHGECGTGIYGLVNPEQEREKIKTFSNWSDIELDFGKHINLVKMKKKERETKPKKISREEAKYKVADYWKEIKQSSPIDQKVIEKYREELRELVQQGHLPARAFAMIIGKMIESGEYKEMQPAYLYVGEYINKMNNDEAIFDVVKIGFSENLENRSKQLAGNLNLTPLKFHILKAWKFKPGYAYRAEQDIHAWLDDLRYEGEFFNSQEGLVPEYVEELVNNYLLDNLMVEVQCEELDIS